MLLLIIPVTIIMPIITAIFATVMTIIAFLTRRYFERFVFAIIAATAITLLVLITLLK